MDLTPEQIRNWRQALCLTLGPYALIMPEEDIVLLKDSMERSLNAPYRISVPVVQEGEVSANVSKIHHPNNTTTAMKEAFKKAGMT